MSVPSGAMVEIDANLIDEGRFVSEITNQLREAHTALSRRRERGTSGGSCKITAEITMGYDPDMRETVVITHSVTLKTPKNESVTLVKEKAGLLLCQPNGSSEDVPEQQRLFDAQGRPIGLLDKRTNEVIEQSPILGKVGG